MIKWLIAVSEIYTSYNITENSQHMAAVAAATQYIYYATIIYT